MEKQLILPEGTDAKKITIAPGVSFGNFLFLSGTAGYDREAMKNLGVVLEAAGSSWDKVVKVNCFLVHDTRDFADWNKVFKEFFPTNPPARTTVEAGIAMEGALIEVDLIAAV